MTSSCNNLSKVSLLISTLSESSIMGVPPNRAAARAQATAVNGVWVGSYDHDGLPYRAFNVGEHEAFPT